MSDIFTDEFITKAINKHSSCDIYLVGDSQLQINIALYTPTVRQNFTAHMDVSHFYSLQINKKALDNMVRICKGTIKFYTKSQDRVLSTGPKSVSAIEFNKKKAEQATKIMEVIMYHKNYIRIGDILNAFEEAANEI